MAMSQPMSLPLSFKSFIVFWCLLNAVVAYKQPEYVGEITPPQDGQIYKPQPVVPLLGPAVRYKQSDYYGENSPYQLAEKRSVYDMIPQEQQPSAPASSATDPYRSQVPDYVAEQPQQPQVAPTYRPQPIVPPPQSDDPNVVLVPRLGIFRGRVGYKQIKNKPINAFLGIKYGKVRSGVGRFQQADPVNHDLRNNEPIDATTIPSNCPQFPDLAIVNASESRGVNVDDCLTLNIYAPGHTGSYPVIFFVHGEMLFDGSAEEGQPDYFLEHDVVLVSANYRLAPFGFLTTLTDDMPGNIALADLHMALDWVQQYIRPFGGNPEQVTLMGQAGGATLVHALSLSNKAEGLFHKLILHSGTALNPYFLDEDPISTARSYARLARCPYYGVNRPGQQTLADCLARLPTTELLKIMENHWNSNEERGLRFTGGFKLVVGDKLGYLEKHPAALVSTSNYPMIAGVTKDVGAFIMSRAMYKQLQQLRSTNASDYISIVLKHTVQPRHYQIWQRWALEHIFSDEELRMPTLNNLARGLLELINLILYRGPVIDSIRSSFRKSPKYLFCFDYRGQFHRFGHLENPLPFATDATLSDDSIYLFPYPEDVSQLNPDDKTLSRTLVTMWVNFAQFNVPNFNPGVWPNVTGEYGPFVRFTNSKDSIIELDYHFGEGIPVPNLYPEYMPVTTTTRRPWINNRYPQQNQVSLENRGPSYPQQQQQPQRSNYPYEHVLNNGETNSQPYYPQQRPQQTPQQQYQQQRYQQNYPRSQSGGSRQNQNMRRFS